MHATAVLTLEPVFTQTFLQSVRSCCSITKERLRTTGYLLPIQIDPFICSVKLILLVFCFGKPVGVSGSTAGCIIFLNGSKIFGSKFPCIKVTCFMRYPLNTQKCSQRKYLTSFLISNQNLTSRPFGIEPLNNTTRALI